MKKWLTASFLLPAAAFAFAACGDEHHHHHDRNGQNLDKTCAQYVSCGTCTPVSGCGWCSQPSGGACVDDPNDCASLPEFSWTWDPGGCPAPNGSASASDAGAAADHAAQ